MAEPQDVTYWSYVELIASSSSQCGLAGIPDDRRVSVVLGDVAPNSYQIGIGALMSQALSRARSSAGFGLRERYRTVIRAQPKECPESLALFWLSGAPARHWLKR
jgi:hypothetical protein